MRAWCTWRCLKAAVSWVMCRVRHLDEHLALLTLSSTSSCSGELLRPLATAASAHKSAKAARQADIVRKRKKTRYVVCRFLVSPSRSRQYFVTGEGEVPKVRSRSCCSAAARTPSVSCSALGAATPTITSSPSRPPPAPPLSAHRWSVASSGS